MTVRLTIRMLLVIVCGILTMLPLNSALINCRLACRRCWENNAYPEMLEVYCAMCDECRNRRRLQGKRNLRTDNDNQLTNDELDGYPDDCVPQAEEPCEEQLLSEIVTTTSTTTTTTTTQRPCSPKPHCVKPTRAPCHPMPCPAVPLAIPVCQMCPMAGSVATAPNPSAQTLPHEQKLLNYVASSTDSVFFYVGVPKKLLKDLKLLNNS